MKNSLIICFLVLTGIAFSQEVEKENQTKIKINYWDVQHIHKQSYGKCYRDEFGESTDEHGKWSYLKRNGELEEVRNYYKGMLHGEVVTFFPNGQKKNKDFLNGGIKIVCIRSGMRQGELNKLVFTVAELNPENGW